MKLNQIWGRKACFKQTQRLEQIRNCLLQNHKKNKEYIFILSEGLLTLSILFQTIEKYILYSLVFRNTFNFSLIYLNFKFSSNLSLCFSINFNTFTENFEK